MRRVGIATGYRLDGRGVGVRVPVGSSLYLLYLVQTGSVTHSASCPMGTGGSFSGVKRPWPEADDSPSNSAEV
jgi:hypothetical protein